MAVIIGIGYGAGGGGPLRELVRGLPAGRGLTVVVVRHPDPEAPPGDAGELPFAASALRAIVAEDGTTLQPDALYLVPPTHLLSLSGGAFVLKEIAGCEGLRMPIDHFFCSLAEQQGPACCGVLLSGDGSDGTLGLSEIKAAGGRTIVQDPAEAGRPEMPRLALAAGVVDAALPAAGIAAALLAFAPEAQDRGPSHDDQSALRSILALLRIRTGHDFRSYKPNTLLRRAHRRMGLAKAGTLGEYRRYLQLHPEEAHQLRRDLLIGVTDFFRQIEAWRYLEERVLPQLVAEAGPGRPVRAWVPACATGKEAYTLAMLLTEAVEASGRKIPIQIFATDADETAIEVARAGRYPEAEMRGVSPERLRRFFTRRGESCQAAKRIRETIVFAQQNITSDPPFAKLDLVSCRNLLIYLDAAAQKRAIEIFHFALRPGGCLVLGSAESIAGHDDLFVPLSKKWRIFRRLAVPLAGRPALPAFCLSEGGGGKPAAGAAGRRGSLALLAQQMLLERFAPAAAIADRRRRLLYNLGPVDRYLTVAPGEGSLDVVEMAREGLRTALRGAFRRAVEEDLVVNVAARVLRDGAAVPVQMTVTPLRAEKGAEALLLVTFEDRTPAAPAAAEEPVCEAGARQLEEELRLTREELSSAVDQLEASNEELKASNEEAMAANEELQSANEELETSKEELQSLNDELQAVNLRLQEKNLQLEASVAESAHHASFPERNPNPVVEADSRGGVSYQNPAARELMPDLAERGLAHPWLAGLGSVAEELARTGARQILREVAVGGATYEQALSLDPETGRIRIYGRDATERRRAGERLERAQAIAHLGSWELDLVDNVLTWSDEVYRIFGLRPQEFGATYEAFLTAVHPDDRAAVNAAYSDSLREGRDSYEIVHRVVRRSTGEIRVVRERCEHLRDAAGQIVRSVGMVHDITERKLAEDALEHSLRRFELLASTAGELLQSPEPQGLVESLCRKVMEYLECQTFFNFLVDEEVGRLHLNAYAGIAEQDARRIEWLDYGVAVCGCVARDGCRIVAERIPTTPDERTELLKTFGITAYCCHPLLGPGGKVLGTLSFGTCCRETFSEEDLSLMKAVADLVAAAMARLRSAERLRRTAEELVRSNKDLEQFAYVSSHDLQEPLRAVSGYMSLLQSAYRGRLDEKAQGYIAHAIDGAKRMAQLIDGLLEYSRVDTRERRVPSFPAREAVDAALTALASAIEENGARVIVEDLPVVTADRTQLTQVFQNLIANALKFRRREAPPEIRIGARLQGSERVFFVRDNGIGIAAEYFDRIFVIFRRLHTRKSYPGTGIGLAIVKKIVERHGGRVWLESAVGEGTTFFFSLPGRVSEE